MTLRISGKHMDIGDAFRTRITDRIGEAIGKYFDRGFAGHVTVVKAGSRYTADCMIRLDSGTALQATGEQRGQSRNSPEQGRPIRKQRKRLIGGDK